MLPLPLRSQQRSEKSAPDAFLDAEREAALARRKGNVSLTVAIVPEMGH